MWSGLGSALVWFDLAQVQLGTSYVRSGFVHLVKILVD